MTAGTTERPEVDAAAPPPPGELPAPPVTLYGTDRGPLLRRMFMRRPERSPAPPAGDQRRTEPAAPLSAVTSLISWALLGLAALAVWVVLFGLLLSGLYESHAQYGLYADLRDKLASGSAPIDDAVPTGTPLAVLSAPRAQLDQLVVVQGTSSSVLRAGPGHQPGTPLPGQAGVPLVLGRAASFGAPFAHLVDLRKGDSITATTGQGVFTYRVEDVRRPGDPFPSALRAGGSQLTLVTAEGDGWRSGWAPTNAVFVDALLQGRSAPAGGARGIATSADGVLKSDTSGLYPLVLWLQLIIVAVAGGIWARVRWGAAQSWLVAVPVALLGLWGASVGAWLLLPNLV